MDPIRLLRCTPKFENMPRGIDQWVQKIYTTTGIQSHRKIHVQLPTNPNDVPENSTNVEGKDWMGLIDISRFHDPGVSAGG